MLKNPYTCSGKMQSPGRKHDNTTDYIDELEIATDEEQEPDYLD